MTDRERFESARVAYLKARERREAHADAMRRKYGPDCSSVYWTNGERNTDERIGAAISRASERLFAVLDKVSPRNWHAGVSWAWVMEHLSWEDATTSGWLAVLPRPGYGTTQREVERFAQPVT